MNSRDPMVIVGAGLAGATAAFALRERGHDGRVVIVGEEATPPYERPPLSKTYLRGTTSLDEALVRPRAAYEDQGIEWLPGRRVTALDLPGDRIELDDGTSVPYGALLLATGASPRRLPATSPGLRGLHQLHTADDADAIRSAASKAEEIVVIGGGWVGSEVAASLRELGRPVTLVTARSRPLEQVLGPEVADVYRGLHVSHGTRLVQGRVVAVEGNRRVAGVRLADGRCVPTDLVVAGLGAEPRIELAASAGLEIADGGIAVDEQLRTAAPSVFAAGDVAAAWHPRMGRRLRVEHWDNAIRQGRTAAANMLGAREPYLRVPYFYSDQFDLGMEYRDLRPPGTGWSCAATWPAAASWRSGSPTTT